MGKNTKFKSRGNHNVRASRATRTQDAAAQELALASDSSLDEGLRDYLSNINQQDSSDAEDVPPGQQLTNSNSDRATSHKPAHPSFNTDIDDDPDSWRPSGLGFHPQHGFGSSAAAAQCADTSLDHTLEDDLARDLGQQAADYDSSDDDSSSSSSSSSSDDTSSGSSDGSEGEDDLPAADSSLDASQPVVLDASGQLQARWHDLALHERFPVQSRQQLAGPSGPSAARGSRGGASPRQRRQDTRSTSLRDTLASNISTATLLTALPGPVPDFESELLSQAVSAATSAAVAEAKQHVARYAELAQQLEQAKSAQKASKRPGRQGKGVKKQLKKAKVAAKRVVREARSDAGALQLLAAMEGFAGSGQDMQALSPCGTRQREGFAKQLAQLFGINAASQGGGSSGRTCLMLQLTADTTTALDGAALQRLQVLLRGELAKEMSSGLIARDDTLASLKQDKKQRRRSSQQQQQQQGSRGTALADAQDYQRPVVFVAAGLLDPNSSLLDHDQYMDTGSATETDSSAGTETDSSAGTESETLAAAAHAGVAGPNHAEVGAFLQSLLLAEDGEGCGDVPAAAGSQDSHGQQHEQQQQQPQEEGAEAPAPLWFVDKQGQQPGAAGSSGTAAPAVTGQDQRQLQGQEPLQKSAAAATAFVPTWFEDRGPQPAVQSHGGQPGIVFVAAAPVADSMTGNTDAAAVGDSGPMYERAGLGLGFNSGPAAAAGGLVGSFAPSDSPSEDDDMQQQQQRRQRGGHAFTSAGPGSRQGQKGKQGRGTDRLAHLEAQFRSLQVPGGRQALETHQERKQRRKQQRQQQRQQQREAARGLSAALEAAGAAAAAAGVQPTYNLTAQQSKKARKQQQRNQRRDANRAAAAAVGSFSPRTAAAAGGAAEEQQQSMSVGFATFEVHTSGIGSRLLGRWGWSEGEGLGRTRQGRAEPLKAERRPKQLGLGYE